MVHLLLWVAIALARLRINDQLDPGVGRYEKGYRGSLPVDDIAVERLELWSLGGPGPGLLEGARRLQHGKVV